jgi:hypothetical protein
MVRRNDSKCRISNCIAYYILANRNILVKYPKLSKTWTRAKVIYCGSNSLSAFLIDEGIIETFNTKNDSILTDLPKNYLSFKPASKLCRLKTTDTHYDINWSFETINYFKKLAANGTKTFYLNSVCLEKESSLHFDQTKVNNELKQLYQKCNEFEDLKQNVKELNAVLKMN